jgi:hypothetical protein
MEQELNIVFIVFIPQNIFPQRHDKFILEFKQHSWRNERVCAGAGCIFEYQSAKILAGARECFPNAAQSQGFLLKWHTCVGVKQNG